MLERRAVRDGSPRGTAMITIATKPEVQPPDGGDRVASSHSESLIVVAVV
jgi:hypothetical protein